MGKSSTSLALWSPPKSLWSCFLSIYSHDTNYFVQGDVRFAQIPNLNSTLLQQLTETLFETNLYVQSFVALREWATPADGPNPYCLVIHSDRRPTGERIRRYNGLQTSEIAATVPGAEDGIVRHQDTVIRWRFIPNENDSGQFDIIPATHRSYGPLTYVLLLSHSTDDWNLNLHLQNSAAKCRQSLSMPPFMFYTYQLFKQPGHFNTILRGRHLFKQ